MGFDMECSLPDPPGSIGRVKGCTAVEFVIARNRTPIGADVWPDDLEVAERIPVRSCVRLGTAIDLVLDRGREFRSQFVFTMARGREMIFWQSARTTKQARPSVALPTARAEGRVLEIVIDTHEQYPWTFTHQQATTSRRALPAGDYAVTVGDRVVAAVERKSLVNLVVTLTSGKLKFRPLDRPASCTRGGRPLVPSIQTDRVRPAVVAAGVAEYQVRYPMVPILFCETRPLAQEWVYRFFGAAVVHHLQDGGAATLEASLPSAPALAPAEPSIAEVRAWATRQGLPVSDRGRLRPEVWTAYHSAH